MTATHELKCWPTYFQEVYQGRKTFEVRLNDRNYQMLDRLRLREFDPDAVDPDLPGAAAGRYTGREITLMVGYILHGVADPVLGTMEAAHSGVSPGYVVLSLVPTPETSAEKRAAYEARHQTLHPPSTYVRSADG